MKIDPYQPPETAIELPKEYNVRGGFFTNGEAAPVECIKAWISLEGDYFRVKYV
jgi:hypothetical protein